MMEKNLFCLYGIFALIMVFGTVCATAPPQPHDDPCQGSEANTDNCPKVWVEVTPAFYPQSPADHTYVKFLDENGQWQSFPCFGACNGGNDLPDTESSTWKDNKGIIQYMADAAPCKWPKDFYLIIGVCHQLANRSLFHTTKIVKNARMYNWSSFVYNTYGDCFWPLKEYCMNNCRESSATIGTWQPGVPPNCLPSGVERARPAEPDVEYQLYMEYFGDPKVTKDVQEMTGLLKSYREKLLTLHAKQRLGDRYLRDYLPMLSKGQDELLERKKALDFRLLESKSLRDDIIDEYNKLFNESLARFRAQMPRDLYEQFFGLGYDEEIDVRIFLPR
jgi:hypothetical protein